ncbi:hypothetical protein [uncultured Ilyobacter sp.]|uniref:hypothetical protein n=1 Tax=uncultured Ilyobacter sp. TaxID=544433 RepID=UPI0029F54CE2|nr:hypothetical protein [uncultured Ilyobacter sp.]
MGKLVYKCLKPFKFNFQGLECNLEIDISGCYEDGSKKVLIKKRKDELRSFPFATISQYAPGIQLEEDEFVLYHWEMYDELIRYLLEKTNYFENTHKVVETELGISPVLRIR